MGACPSSTPFRRRQELVTGIDLPDFPLKDLREQVIATAASQHGMARVLTLTCRHSAGAALDGAIVLPCVAMAPPSLIDFILSRGHADGVCIAGCAERGCQNRMGIEWTRQRFAGKRDPYLRPRVPRERIACIWAGPSDGARLNRELEAFRKHIAELPADTPRAHRSEKAPEHQPERVE